MTSTIGIPIKLLNEAQVGPLPSLLFPACCSLLFVYACADFRQQGHIVTLEITSGQTYRGRLLEGKTPSAPTLTALLSSWATSKLTRRAAEDNMNVQLKDITVTARDGRVSHLEQVYIRGSHVRFFIVPDMLRNAPMFRSRNVRGRGVGLARGRATVSRARAGGRGGGRP